MTQVIILHGADGSVEVTGHAGYAERGQDIVCAGVSSICNSLIAVFCVLEAYGHCHGLSFGEEEGRFWLTFCGGDEEARAVLVSYELLFSKLEGEFPTYLRLT